jgi:hypothetical protein
MPTLAATRTALVARRRFGARRWPRAWLSYARAHPTRLAAGLIALAVALRLALAALGWPPTDSDEGTMGLMARHIAYQSAHPIFFYGQHYMGALEAYVAAGFFRVFGASLFALRAAIILISALALVAIYLLARRLAGQGVALFSLALLAIGSQEALSQQTFARGGYAETLLFGALALLLAIELARENGRTPLHRSGEGQGRGNPSRSRSPQRGAAPALPPPVGEGAGGEVPRLAAYAALGVVVGLGVWSDVLVLPFALGALALLAVFRWRALLGRAGLCLALGLLLGAAPLLIYAARAPGHNPFAGAAGVQQSGSAYAGNVVALFAGEVVGTVAESIPIMTGGAALVPLTPTEAWPLSASGGPLKLLATALRALWGLGYLALLAGALWAAWRALRAQWPGKWKLALASRAEREALVIQSGRLVVLLGAVATVLLFAASPVAARAPTHVARYLIGLLIALPVTLAPLWRAADRSPQSTPLQEERMPWWNALPALGREPGERSARRRIAARLALGVVALAYLCGLVEIAGGVPAARATLTQQSALIADLERLGATRIYSDYWTCDRVAFLSAERIICAALDHQLQPDLDRFPPYRALVAATSHPAYVFATGSPQAAAFAARAAATPGAYTLERRDGYVIYRSSSAR